MKTRAISLDFLKLLAASTMILAHTINFFGGRNQLLYILEHICVVVSFSAFLFASGGSSFFAYLKMSDFSKIPGRIFKLIIIYYITATIVYLGTTSARSFAGIGEILIFKALPEYTEYIVAFILFSISILALKPLWNSFINKHPFVIGLILVLTYIIGYSMSFINFHNYPGNLLYLISGHTDIYRFPILQYFPIFISGILYSKYLYENNNQLNLFWVILPLLIISIFLFPLKNQSWDNRWPPSLIFINIGIIYSIMIVIFANRFRLNNLIERVIEFFAKRILSIFVLHIIILIGFSYFIDKQQAFISILLIYLAIWIIITLVFILQEKASLWYNNYRIQYEKNTTK